MLWKVSYQPPSNAMFPTKRLYLGGSFHFLLLFIHVQLQAAHGFALSLSFSLSLSHTNTLTRDHLWIASSPCTGWIKTRSYVGGLSPAWRWKQQIPCSHTTSWRYQLRLLLWFEGDTPSCKNDISYLWATVFTSAAVSSESSVVFDAGISAECMKGMYPAS